MGDVMPYFLPVYVFLVAHTVYYLTGNLMIALWLMFCLNPLINYCQKDTFEERPNIPASLEKNYIDDWRFLVPLYLYVLLDACTHVWTLCVVSTEVNLEYSIFENRLKNAGQWFAFLFVWGYTSGVGGLAGHELIHKKQMIHKITGTYTFTKFFYSHFFLEHLSGHHKHIATPEDPATPRFNEDIYSFALRSACGGFVNSWKREIKKTSKRHL